VQSSFTSWPNGRKMAIAITVMFEVWPDGKGPPNLVQRMQVNPGAVDHQAITWPHYAGKEGVWRLIRLLDRHGVPSTFCTNARCAEVYPDAVAQIVRSLRQRADVAHGDDRALLFQRQAADGSGAR
jgi:allantoinase